MSQEVKSRRRYDSPRRREQAAATRLAILEAAERLFADRGYAGTSVAAVAEEARVALKTVYAVFGTKAELLRALWNLRMRGDEEPQPMTQRPWFQAIVEEPDPDARLGLVARSSREVKERTAEVTEIVRQAARADPEVGALWDRFQRELHEVGMRRVAETLAADGALGPDVPVATDVLWMLNHPDVYQLLVRQRGWTPEAYEAWLATALRRELLCGS